MKKNLGFAGVFCISAGAMISSGLFILPGVAFAKAGPAVFLSYFVAGIVALSSVFSLSELITAMPKAGGDYYYVSRSFGQLFGTVTGLLSWFALSLKSAFAIIGIAEIISISFGVNLILSAVLLSLFFTGVNLAGMKEAVRFQILLVLLLLSILITFIITGLPSIEPNRFSPLLPKGVNSLFSTAGFVFVSFGGVLTTASVAGEIKNPSKTVPLGLIGSITVVTLLYSAVTFITVGLLPGQTLASSLTPIAEAGRAGGGIILYAAITAASLLAFITTANGGILTASQYPVALSRDRMLPALFSKPGKKSGTQYTAIIATGLLICAAVLLELDLLIKAASTVILLTNIFAHLSVIVMRESRIVSYKPTYSAPFYPWLQIIGIIVFVLLIFDMGLQPVLISTAFTAVGVILYFIRRRHSDTVSPAVIHIIQRITNKELAIEGLQKELRSLVEDRDNIIRDEFDDAIENSCFLEINENIGLDELWDTISQKMTECLAPELSPDKVKDLLKEREEQSSTCISEFVAVPHLITEGSGIFRMGFIRAPEGVRFDTEKEAVKAVFVLIGTKDMRNLHLRALAAIAQIVQQPNFEEHWLKAGSHNDIIDFFILSKRRR